MRLRHHIPSGGLRRAALTSVVIALGLPATSTAATSRATVLLVDAPQHYVALVGAHGNVRGYNYARRLSNVRFGSRITYRVAAGFVRVLGVERDRLSRVSFYARVIASGTSGVVLRLGDGTLVAFGPSQVTPASAPFKAGRRMLVTEVSSGGLIHVFSGSAHQSRHSGGNGSGHGGSGNGSKGGAAGGEFVPRGAESAGTGAVVVEGDSDHVVLQLPDGTTISPLLPPAALTYMNANTDLGTCEVINFAYHRGPAGLVLDSFAPTGMSASASVYVPANQDTCAVESAGGADAVGTIVGLTTNSVTINIPGSGPMTFSVDPTGGVTDGNSVGDVVDVNYTPNADGTLAAGSLSWTEQYTTGTVTAATSNGLTVKDAVTGQPETFLANDAGFAGISRGDVVSVTYYVSGGALEADNVSDYTTGTNG